MNITYDKDADAISIWFDGVQSHKTIDISEDIFFDLDNTGKLAGIEILHASKKSNLEDFFNIHFNLPNNKKMDVVIPSLW